MLSALLVVAAVVQLRVAIAGGGPGGLTLAHALCTLPGRPCEVTVYEAKPELSPAIGGGLQLSSGADVLSRLGIDVSEVAAPLRTVVSRQTGGREVLCLDVQRVMRDESAAQLGGGDGDGAFSIMRDALLEMLVSRLPEGTVRLGMPFESATSLPDGRGVACVFGGQSVEADVLVGFDGIGSSVLSHCFGDSEKYYSGINVLFCVAPAGSRPPGSESQFHQYLGDGGYALSASYGGRLGVVEEMVALCTREPESGARGAAENAGWEEDALRERALSRAAAAQMPEDLTRVIRAASRFYETPVCFRAPRLGWSRGGHVILAGDAAHAMPPFLGQGANQAICDAYSLAALLKRVAPGGSPAGAIAAFERARAFPTARLQLNSRLLGFLETQASDSFPGSLFRDVFFFLAGKLGVARLVFLDGALPRGVEL